ncbi:WXG100 family type VII secretion target [Nocardia cyriacigeorgica]|uniref:ESAT-6-like protein n=1 Tax=Nocardia cyriacigeorgica TaxID=135487 RepID=A0A6P1CRB6_9NOCA|nr:WXG100 family type VII secretion target [Nocardia cyriacigeorgica]NEW34437.1 WXG100 family type VII secretion target [Nocardia cyriacigeorgica]
MNSEFRVDIDCLDNIVGRLSGLADFIAGQLDDLENKVNALHGTGWEGVAAQAYADAHAQWTVGAREFSDGVRQLSGLATDAHTQYRAAADMNRRMSRGG